VRSCILVLLGFSCVHHLDAHPPLTTICVADEQHLTFQMAFHRILHVLTQMLPSLPDDDTGSARILQAELQPAKLLRMPLLKPAPTDVAGRHPLYDQWLRDVVGADSPASHNKLDRSEFGCTLYEEQWPAFGLGSIAQRKGPANVDLFGLRLRPCAVVGGSHSEISNKACLCSTKEAASTKSGGEICTACQHLSVEWIVVKVISDTARIAGIRECDVITGAVLNENTLLPTTFGELQVC